MWTFVINRLGWFGLDTDKLASDHFSPWIKTSLTTSLTSCHTRLALGLGAAAAAAADERHECAYHPASTDIHGDKSQLHAEHEEPKAEAFDDADDNGDGGELDLADAAGDRPR